MAVQYCNYDIKGTLAVTGTSTLSGIVTITEATSNPLLNIYNTSNGGGATIRFSDQTSQTQVGDITFYHSDSSSQGGGASWHFVSEPDTVLVVGSGSVNGRFVAKSAGSVAEVDYGFFDDVNTGMYRAATDTVRLAGGGVYNLSVSNTNAALYYQSGLRFQTTSSGAKVEGGLVIEGATDSILTLNQTGTDTGWSYINFNTLGTRNYYVGQDASKNFNIYNDNIDVIAISVSYTSNLTTIGGDLTVTGGDIILSGTGRIQGVDTVSTSTDATNKAYVDSAVSGAGVGTFLPLSGGVLTGNVRWNDAKAALFGSGQDMHIYHYLGQNYIDTYNGNLILTSHETDADIIFKSDNGSGGVTEYFRLDGSSARTIFTRNTQHVDNSKAIFGNGDDLQIYHDGSNSYIDDASGTGSLYVNTNAFRLVSANKGENMIRAFEDDAVILSHNNIDRLTTTSTGVTVTGAATATTFLGDLNGTINTATTGVTQTAGNNSTLIATTAYADAAAGAVPIGNYLPLTGGTLTGALVIDTAGGAEKMTLNNEFNTAPIADTFTGNTSKSYISFGVVAGSNDPGFIMHESSATETNEGVLHLCPSDDNSTGDYISIHGSNDPDVLNLHTSGLIETVNLQLQIKSGSGNVYLNDSVDIANNLLVSGAATITSDLTVNGGDITLGGTGRIQGIDTVSASTDAASKNLC